ncbi:uncharacterized protein Bfra_004516 [Botrytis fragariae]|uniref:Uncharacterized protein n=1 Tax=Botrytis fragariae TaxID=1964551 RepID=A0A8H6AVS7_9HELO|nr:uncharacterized protein Bfra_004516 [Botrytis fragariae]KAF5874506.1 hypothetical protein Bfra_004516 [Botrytis fragariae]
MVKAPPIPPREELPNDTPISVVEFVLLTTRVTEHIRAFLNQAEQQSFNEMAAELYRLLQLAHTKVRSLKAFSDKLRLDKTTLEARTASFDARFNAFQTSHDKILQELKQFQETLIAASNEKVESAQNSFATAKTALTESTKGITSKLISIAEFMSKASEKQKLAESSCNQLVEYVNALEQNKILLENQSALERCISNLKISHVDEIAAYSTEGNILDSENQRLREQCFRYTAEIETLQSKSAGDDEELRNLREEALAYRRLQEEFFKFKEESSKKDATMNSLKASVDNYDAEVPELKRTLQTNVETIDRLKQDLGNTKSELKSSTEKVGMLEAEISTANIELKKLRPVNMDLSALRTSHAELQKTRGRELEECTEHTSEIASLTEINSALKTELFEVNSKLQQALRVDPFNSKKRKMSEANESQIVDDSLTVYSKSTSHHPNPSRSSNSKPEDPWKTLLTSQLVAMRNLQPLPHTSDHDMNFVRGLISRCLVHPKSLENHDLWKKVANEKKDLSWKCLFEICNSNQFDYEKLSILNDESTKCTTCKNQSLDYCVQVVQNKGRFVRLLKQH